MGWRAFVRTAKNEVLPILSARKFQSLSNDFKTRLIGFHALSVFQDPLSVGVDLVQSRHVRVVGQAAFTNVSPNLIEICVNISRNKLLIPTGGFPEITQHTMVFFW
ncbi:hypothetical protein DPMN_007606 [Dreissena polymorpha]|uniref:Uncharacterized protein n=1 Tax=Dreissena polymorpha TaxID=45954 RepID=A0A9D4MXB0_DREPO|nr:hypothetical protein DPMN_007606 [Dreissena polymorpha]